MVKDTQYYNYGVSVTLSGNGNVIVSMFSKRRGILGLVIIGSYIVVYILFSILGCVLGAKTSKIAQKERGENIKSSHPQLKGVFYAIICTSVVIVFIYWIPVNNDGFRNLVHSLWCSVLIPLLLGYSLQIKASSLSSDVKTDLISEAYYKASGAYYGIIIFPFLAFILLAIANTILDL